MQDKTNWSSAAVCHNSVSSTSPSSSSSIDKLAGLSDLFTLSTAGVNGKLATELDLELLDSSSGCSIPPFPVRL